MGHHHGQDHGPHGHGPHGQGANNEKRVLWAFVLTAGFMGVEVVGGLISGSLALLADAAHMLTDAAALGLAWFAFRVARRPADTRRSYGYHRGQVLAAFVNGGVLIAVVGWIFIEAIARLREPVPVQGWTMLVVAGLGLVVNIAAFAILHGGDRQNLNMRGAAAHVLGDLLGSAAAIVGALIILWTGWMPIDPLLSMLVGLLVLRSAWFVVRESAHIMLEGTPADIDPAALRRTLMEAVPELEDVHHIHAWSLTPERPLLTLHARVTARADHQATLESIKKVLAERFSIDHSTVQIEREACGDD
ncbi:cation diffusion facilitator family transporter [Pelagibius litoralis]|uniref:Cation diffusion facilitator family transporter n=1 Tax=Pelagibius litoralis TaxID=374515 RepID=A0A967EVS2_9PROT|nr:cation diffusion facilitator family transporter [Pelagibius litoralis]NIA69111.1 cation diffusion facilitator family transporter [Pelagibius litoralis]